MRRIAILGSTGSVGTNACRVAAALSAQIQVTGLAAGKNSDLLIQQREGCLLKRAISSCVRY